MFLQSLLQKITKPFANTKEYQCESDTNAVPDDAQQKQWILIKQRSEHEVEYQEILKAISIICKVSAGANVKPLKAADLKQINHDAHGDEMKRVQLMSHCGQQQQENQWHQRRIDYYKHVL
ncbi:hypothetical protein MP228_003428 [Amoeboaphelidium protococcarum]|nr:hypothetical protein MP228_003428 [Amoeboaphelidium protococcarum]